MRYLPHTPEDIALMLQAVGVENPDALFTTIPDGCRRKDPPNLPEPMTEWELDEHMAAPFGGVRTPASRPRSHKSLHRGGPL